MDRASGVDTQSSPSPGDITLCIRCGHVMAFDEGLRFRQLNDEEIKDVAGDPRIIAVQKARAGYRHDS